MCRTGLQHRNTLNQRIFELANGLPFLASDMSVHELLGARTVVEKLLDLQVALGKIHRASGHFRAGCWPSIPIAYRAGLHQAARATPP